MFRLFICCLTSNSRIFRSYGDFILSVKGCKFKYKLGNKSLWAVREMCRVIPSVAWESHFYDKQRIQRTYSNSSPHYPPPPAHTQSSLVFHKMNSVYKTVAHFKEKYLTTPLTPITILATKKVDWKAYLVIRFVWAIFF